MENILITGASGNIGYELLRGLEEIRTAHHIVAADFNPERSKEALEEFQGLEFRKLDFTDPSGFEAALEEIDLVFLLRPPQLADVQRYFEPFVDAMQNKGIRRIVFLSVQGVESQKRIPHYKIEKLIRDKGLEFVFLRPSYFMQNLTTTLVREIRQQNKIFIPAGNMKLTWVDARDIGRVGARILDDFNSYSNNAYEITGSEQKDFSEVADLLSVLLERKIIYESPGLVRFFREKRKAGMAPNMIFVMIMLHYMPRFSRSRTVLTSVVQEIAGRHPATLETFIKRERNKFNP